MSAGGQQECDAEVPVLCDEEGGPEVDEDGARRMSKRVVQKLCRERGELCSPECCTTLYLQASRFKLIQGLQDFKAVRVLHLENNCLSSCEGLAHMTDLRALYLQHNHLSELQGLAGCTALATLNISSNPITHFSPGALPASILTLHAGNTAVSDPSSIQALAHDCPQLQVLDLQHTAGLQDAHSLLACLCHLAGLRVLYTQGCPLATAPNHRRVLVSGLPGLHYLDNSPVDEVERLGARAWLQGGKQAEQAARLAYRQEQRAAMRRTTLTFAVERAKRRLRNALGPELAANEPLLQEDTQVVVQRLVEHTPRHPQLPPLPGPLTGTLPALCPDAAPPSASRPLMEQRPSVAAAEDPSQAATACQDEAAHVAGAHTPSTYGVPCAAGPGRNAAGIYRSCRAPPPQLQPACHEAQVQGGDQSCVVTPLESGPAGHAPLGLSDAEWWQSTLALLPPAQLLLLHYPALQLHDLRGLAYQAGAAAASGAAGGAAGGEGAAAAAAERVLERSAFAAAAPAPDALAAAAAPADTAAPVKGSNAAAAASATSMAAAAAVALAAAAAAAAETTLPATAAGSSRVTLLANGGQIPSRQQRSPAASWSGGELCDYSMTVGSTGAAASHMAGSRARLSSEGGGGGVASGAMLQASSSSSSGGGGSAAESPRHTRGPPEDGAAVSQCGLQSTGRVLSSDMSGQAAAAAAAAATASTLLQPEGSIHASRMVPEVGVRSAVLSDAELAAASMQWVRDFRASLHEVPFSHDLTTPHTVTLRPPHAATSTMSQCDTGAPAACTTGDREGPDLAEQQQQRAQELEHMRQQQQGQEEEGPPECPVCCCELSIGHACVLLAPCQHLFHAACIKKWVLTALLTSGARGSHGSSSQLGRNGSSSGRDLNTSDVTCPVCRAAIVVPAWPPPALLSPRQRAAQPPAQLQPLHATAPHSTA